jgi:hypothetical protein
VLRLMRAKSSRLIFFLFCKQQTGGSQRKRNNYQTGRSSNQQNKRARFKHKRTKAPACRIPQAC